MHALSHRSHSAHFIFSHLCNLAHDLGGRLEAKLVTSSVYEGVQGLTLGLAVEVKRNKNYYYEQLASVYATHDYTTHYIFNM